MKENKKHRLERLMFLMLTAQAGKVDAILLKDNQPQVDVIVAISSMLQGQKIPVAYGFEKEVKRCLDKNIPDDWADLMVEVFNTILEEYG